jgi:aminopeptidase N
VDHPSDKATAEMVVTAPAQYQVVSNGLLVETTDLPGQRRRTHWKQDQPLPVWLYNVAIARFAVHYADPVGRVPLQSWVFPQERDMAWKVLEDTARPALRFFSERIAPFPYDKLANVEAVSLYGGMESATAIFYDQKLFKGVPLTNIVAHEIAHQWFGDSATEADWDEVWLSEGFATYLADCFIEHAKGRAAFVEGLQAERRMVIAAEADHPDTPILHRNLSDMKQVLNTFVYEKAAWVLHMLRLRVGEDAFWQGVRAYYLAHQHGLATTADFRRAMEAASGQKLEAFFTQWLTRSNLPKLEGSWQYDADLQLVIVNLRQTQAGDPFQLPLTLNLGLGLGERTETVILTQKQHQFSFRAATAPAFIELDPNTGALIDGPSRLEFRDRSPR